MIAADSHTLTIDDDPAIARLISAALGIPSHTCASGAAFHASSAELARPLAVFVDINLGSGDNGLDLLPAIRSQWPHVPILVITAGSDDKAIGQALAAGANDFLLKPFNRVELKARFLARSNEMLERSGRDLLQLGDVQVDRRLHRLSNAAGDTSFLSSSDIDLLVFIAQANGAMVEREAIKRRLWGHLKVSENALDKKLFQIRQALKSVSTQVKLQALYGKGVKVTTSQSERGAA